MKVFISQFHQIRFWLCSVMAPPWQQLHCSLCINFYWVCCTAYLLRPSSGAPQSRYAGLLFLVDAGARRSNSAKFSTEQTLSQTPKQQHNIWLIFKIKQCVLMPAQKSQKKRHLQALPLIHRLRTLHVVFSSVSGILVT